MAVPETTETTETPETPASSTGVDPVLKAVSNNPFLGTTLIFLLAGCIKLMAVSNWNVTTALAILGRTDTTSLLTETFLSLFPAMVSVLTAGAVWWWIESLEKDAEGRFVFRVNTPVIALVALGVIQPFVLPYLAYVPFCLAGSALLGFLLDACLWQLRTSPLVKWWSVRAILLIIYGGLSTFFFFKIASNHGSGWQVVAVDGLGVAAAACAYWGLGKARRLGGFDQESGLRAGVRNTAFTIAFGTVLGVLLLGTSWLPPERVVLREGFDIGSRANVASSEAVCGASQATCQTLSAYILSDDAGGTVLLTDRERAIVQLPKDAVIAHEVCNFAPSSSWRWTLIIQHPSQLATGTPRTSPYAYCPDPPPLSSG